MFRSKLSDYVNTLYRKKSFSPCSFTDEELAGLVETNEMLVYVPQKLTVSELCDSFGIKININLEHEKMIRTVMNSEDQWFVCSANPRPELLYQSASKTSIRFQEEGLHGMDLRRYLAFAATFKMIYGSFPDQQYWTFLLSGTYDRSGISIVGFDRDGILSHHGWMKDFKAKFVGSRYIALPPRIEITPETEQLLRAYRGLNSVNGREAGVD